MSMSVTELRANLYKVVDQVISTGIPVEIERHGVILKLVPEHPKSKLSRLSKHPDVIVGDVDDIVHMDWSHEWKGKKLP
jgi:antitoxin (DNA-binding transcriptional repressor) of toxin-antitoxin stability system